MTINNREHIQKELRVASQASSELFNLAYAFNAVGNEKVCDQLSHLAEDLGRLQEAVSALMHEEVMGHLNHGNEQLGKVLSCLVMKEIT